MNQKFLKGIYWRLTGIIMAVVLLALSGVSILSHRTFEHALTPELAQKANSVLASARSLVLKAVEHGIAYDELYDVDATLKVIQEENPEFTYLAATDRHGRALYQSGTPSEKIGNYFSTPRAKTPDAALASAGEATLVGSQYLVSVPVVGPDGPLGALHAGIDSSFVNGIFIEMLLDVLVILVVSLFFTLELINFLAGARLQAGLTALNEIIERGCKGDFTNARERSPEADFGGVLKLLDAAVERVNSGFVALSQDIEDARRGPAHERNAGLTAANVGLQELCQRYRFGASGANETKCDSDLARVRAPLFAFILAEELTRSFLPTYVHSLLVPVPWLATEIVVGLPIVIFMLIVALGQPYLGAYCERVGQRRAMLNGAGIAAVGFMASALAYSVIDLLLWRALCAFGYAMVFVAAQSYVLDHTTQATRARGFAIFVGAIMVATVCGPSIGGILSDNIGHRATFVLSAVLAFISIVAIRLLPVDQPHPDSPEHPASQAPRLSDITALLFNRRFITLTGLAAVPAKIILTGICFYLVPLYIASIGSTQAMTGRVLMTYAVVMVLMSPFAATMANTRSQREYLVIGGLLVSGLGGVLMLANTSVIWVFVAVFFIGLGQSLSITAQSALVSDQCEEEIARMGDHSVYGVYRLLERVGNALGPLVAAGLVMTIGYERSFVAIGAMAIGCGLAFWYMTRAPRVPAHATIGA